MNLVINPFMAVKGTVFPCAYGNLSCNLSFLKGKEKLYEKENNDKQKNLCRRKGSKQLKTDKVTYAVGSRDSLKIGVFYARAKLLLAYISDGCVYSTFLLFASGESSSGTADDVNTKFPEEKSALTEENEDNLWAGPAKITEDKSRFLLRKLYVNVIVTVGNRNKYLISFIGFHTLTWAKLTLIYYMLFGQMNICGTHFV